MRNYFRNGFIIFPCGKGHVVYNLRKDFDGGHSHLRSFKSCKDAITFVTNKVIPKTCSNYYLTTLKRLSNDKGYIARIDDLIRVRKRKGKKQKYRNRPAMLR